MILQSERLSIRMLNLEDLEQLHKLQSNPNVMKYITNRPKSLEETEKELYKIVTSYDENQIDFLVLAVCLTKSKEFIGTCAVIKNEEKKCEIGYRLQEEHWGYGYGSELTKRLLIYCFEERNIDTVIANVETRNHFSVKIIENNGFELINEEFDEEIGDFVRTYQKDNK
ncbi:GNAT family N-acetyltransferase [Gottfriedia solisilvae]|uniref:GNAT family N-acetyltransferase n=1 Tax=Gottfriedia solisilvae TaxID=1516104 RepID=UPI003D2F2CF9